MILTVSQHFEKINGKMVLVREVVRDNFIEHDLPRIIAMTLLCSALLVMFLSRNKPKK